MLGPQNFPHKNQQSYTKNKPENSLMLKGTSQSNEGAKKIISWSVTTSYPKGIKNLYKAKTVETQENLKALKHKFAKPQASTTS